ncbi:MAG: hydantoinase/oxoprolinase family protein, partial [Halioglobus sp.]|nr:hydantoinase/oxoprolinase family protein [Halioglobus sp.]
DPVRLTALWRELAQRAGDYFSSAGFDTGEVTANYQLNMRYPGQNWVLTFTVEVSRGLDDLSFIDSAIGQRAIEAFNARHMAEYGHIREDEMPEITGVRLATTIETESPVIGRGFTATARLAQACDTRRANLGEGFSQTNVFRGADLQPGHEVCGPAIIEESFTTIVVSPGWRAVVDDSGDYELRQEQAL